MRADRLVAALLFLQARGRVTAAELAAELEVSERTARRDLEALTASGVPVYAQRGRGGGWRLVGGARTDLTGLSAPEVQALFLAAGASAASPNCGPHYGSYCAPYRNRCARTPRRLPGHGSSTTWTGRVRP